VLKTQIIDLSFSLEYRSLLAFIFYYLKLKKMLKTSNLIDSLLMKPFNTFGQLIDYSDRNYNNPSALNYRPLCESGKKYEEGKWKSISTHDFFRQVRFLALGMRKLGFKKGDTVGVQARPSPFWIMADLAIISAGGISVPLFAHMAEEIRDYEIRDAKMEWMIAVGQESISTLGGSIGFFEKVIGFDIDASTNDRFISSDDVMKLGRQVLEENPNAFDEMVLGQDPDDVVTIIYTSGSTGFPKGVMLTHRNLISQVKGSHARMPLHLDSDRVLSALPLAHIFERMVDYYYISGGVSLYFMDDIKNLSEIYREVKPTIHIVVPKILERIYAKITNKILSMPFLLRQLASLALWLAQQEKVNWWQNILRASFDAILYGRFREAMGGCLRGVISGGAALRKDLNVFFVNIGIPVHQGYGLTETSPVLTVNPYTKNKPGTVGIPYPRVKIKIADDGEILAKGPNVMKGYYNKPEETAAVFTADGWFKTGDLGSIDEEGFLTITGRIKEVLKTSGGKMITPVPIEEKLTKSPLIDIAMVVGEGKNYVTCLLFPDLDAIHEMKKRFSMEELSDEEFLKTSHVEKRIEKLIDKVNRQVNEWEKIRDWRFSLEKLTVAGGELTPTLKLRRHKVREKFKDLIETMYQESGVKI
jgi:long-chain acyl-CoA synthetase